MVCHKCGQNISPERIEALPNTTTCVKCSRENRKVGFMVSPHKTGAFLVLVDSGDKESLRLASRANRRSR